MNRRRYTLVLVVSAVLVGTGTVLWLLVLRPGGPQWRAALRAQPMMEMPENPNPRSSAEGINRTMFLKNDLQRREFWGKDEVDEIVAMIEAHPLDLVPVENATTDGEWERYFLARDAIESIRTRLGIGAPIDPTERERLIEALLRYSRAAAPSIRLSMAETLCWTGLIFEDDRADARVKEMMNDPDPMVASNARSQHRFHTQGRERWAEYQRRLGKDRG